MLSSVIDVFRPCDFVGDNSIMSSVDCAWAICALPTTFNYMRGSPTMLDPFSLLDDLIAVDFEG
jgi:hypothetical protein